jgi:hypothetical protein
LLTAKYWYASPSFTKHSSHKVTNEMYIIKMNHKSSFNKGSNVKCVIQTDYNGTKMN